MTEKPVTQDDLYALLKRPEELNPELAVYLEQNTELGFPAIRHPLVYSVVHAPQMNALVNEQLRRKRLAVQEAKRTTNWHSYVYLHERPYRLDAFRHICWLLKDKEYWSLLGSIWTDAEKIGYEQDEWRECLTADRYGRWWMMRKAERDELRLAYPRTIHVYRGFHRDDRRMGLSWTSNPIVAKWFARRLAGPDETPRVVSGVVDKRDVIAFFDGRSEYEMVLLPENVRDLFVVRHTRGEGMGRR
jgi:hypothetical protein